jgi:squalene-associated FAD-dependent desaturase
MQCCKELGRWIDLTESKESWRNEDTLHFVSKLGKRITIRGWPLPAPFHLSGLLLGWPDLTIADRARVGLGLISLLSSKNTEQFQCMPALRWLEQHFQNRRTIANFWATILVSALGEQIDRVAMGPVKKVLVDGFAATRDAYHLLVPTIPLAQWMEDANRKALQAMRVDVRCASAVSSLQKESTGRWAIPSTHHSSFDSVVVAVPWHRIQSLLSDVDLPLDLQDKLAATRSLESSPITGVHTWWDRPWLEQPHAILIDRLCQWVFPGPESSGTTNLPNETYYQIVISGSRQLPKGKSEAILEWVRADLAEVFPEAAKSTLLRGKVVTDPQSVFSVSPGHEASRLHSNALASEGIFLGGDWTDTGWPATMEGALRSGLLAAEGALAYLGRPARLLE